MSVSRRAFFTKGGLLAAGFLAVETPALAACQRVNGAGSYLLGPFAHAQQKDRPVFLTTDLGFDETIVWCKVATNFEPFLFPTAKLGVVELAAHEFFMDMQSTRIDSVQIQFRGNTPVAVYAGALRSEPRLFSGQKAVTFIEEEINFDCEAQDLGPRTTVEVSAKNFVMTAKFNATKEHAAIFGDQVTFAGHLTRGNISVTAIRM